MLPGQKLVKFSSLTRKERGVRHYEETKGRVLTTDYMTDSIAEMHSRNNTITESTLNPAYIKNPPDNH